MQNTSRAAALEILERCRRDHAWSGAALDAAVKKYGLDRRDAALASRLSLGVLQNTAYCDYYIEQYASRRAESLQPKLLDILRLGVYQLIFLDKIPSRAAVNETVALCRGAGMERSKGLVNAVLRRVAENRAALPPIPGEGSADYLSIRYSHALWLVKRLLAEHEHDFVEGFLAANNRIHGLTIQVNTQKVSAEEYTRALSRVDIPYTEYPELPGCLSLEGGTVSSLPGFEEGLFYVQDRAARSAVSIAGLEPEMRVLDACAAPGGKSFAAALDMKDRGRILSCDIHEKKLRLIQSGAERLGLSCVETLAHDARAFIDDWEGAFDCVMADVPCSGLGVIGKRPEIRNKAEQEIAGLPAIQRRILETVSRYVRRGGTLLYSTCTVLNAENTELVEHFLADHSEFEAVAFSIGERTAENGMYTFWPHVDGTDGFFVAKMRRKG